MPNHKSAIKRVKQTERKTEVNRNRRSKIRTAVKSLHKLIAEKNKEKAYSEFRVVESEMRKGVTKGVTKKGTASRQISRLSAIIKKAFAA
ncbi:MAG: 30S ribosomal protein S20 [Rickettsiales bacterium]|jgi:small subunit ribosomal protein S20|nr:30S ribosomal protein S20 [Rickettsiales bacterium]